MVSSKKNKFQKETLKNVSKNGAETVSTAAKIPLFLCVLFAHNQIVRKSQRERDLVIGFY